MGTARPESLILQTDASKRQSSLVDEISLSSSDSTNERNINFNGKNSSQKNELTTTSTTTTDSDLESEREDNQQLEELKNENQSQERISRHVKHFRKLFKSEIRDDMPKLIDSYVCAYQGDILLQGKMFITDRYLCFHSRIINYVTKHVYRWEQIRYVTKERVAFIFPTAIGIQLNYPRKKVIYASFLSRDQAYDKILFIWARSTNNTNVLENSEKTLTTDGTLKIRNKNGKMKGSKHDSSESLDTPEQEVLHMYLKESNNNDDDDNRRSNLVIPKSKKEKYKGKKLINSYNTKKSGKISNVTESLSNILSTSNSNETKQYSRYTQNKQEQNFSIKKDDSTDDPGQTSLVQAVNSNTNHDQTSSMAYQTTTNTNSFLNTSNVSLSIKNQTDTTILKDILKSIFSIINMIIQAVLTLFNYCHIYSIRTTSIILLFLTILFFHSFYLITLAYRIENRLQSLNNLWPSSIRNSLLSNSKRL